MEGGGDEGASVGEAMSESSGNMDGSKSRSGIGGDKSGRRVIRMSTMRKAALRRWSIITRTCSFQTHFMTSMSTTPLHRALEDTVRLRPISSNNCTNLMISRVRAAHL